MEVAIERGGTFHAINMVPNSHKCAAMRTKRYSYFVKVWATDQRLTKEGFVLNNEHIQKYFDERWGRKASAWDAISCERLAIVSALELLDICKKEADVKRVQVRIKGSNGAWITAECQHPN